MTEIKYPDQRSKRFIFVPFCLLCQAFQARGIVRFGFSSVIKPIFDELLKHDLNIIQMPCPESRLGGYEKGLQRGPRGIEDYNTPEFLAICDVAANEVLQMIKAIINNGFEVVGILGLEYSPSCSVLLQYSNKGTTHHSGHFIAALQRKLRTEQIKVPFIGINRRGIKASIKKIRELICKKLF
ncbi:hypothetical protein KKE19_03445 [Patescibacteria group bacterium]|nr:hypothetical protein [Patescibacteria group bacterium]MBU4274843.1 hypothetical protein [Patescibacteria group bacterium]MBU4367988.1 hypothetical protein [Patescibacteria group bacterium]MBU4462169.1 hypothetical protein [Patescibacteria group bacterium]MCG2699832.1 hypothetical protein [Candidatus Parcubacteria bacterium]